MSGAIVLVNYRSHALLKQGLAPLATPETSVIVVDNFSTAGELAALRRLAGGHGWTVISSPRNVGFGAGVNLGVRHAIERGCERFLVLNPDVRITAPTVQALLDHVSRSPSDVVSPVITRPDGSTWFAGGWLDPRSGRVGTGRRVDLTDQTAWLTAACLALSRFMWDRVGGFDPDYFMYWEDVDLSRRCRRAGGTLVVRDDLRVVHDVGGTQGTRKSELYMYYNCRNRLLFAARWLSGRGRLAWAIRTPAESYRIVIRAGRRALLSPLALAALRGSLAGLAVVLRRRTRREATR